MTITLTQEDLQEAISTWLYDAKHCYAEGEIVLDPMKVEVREMDDDEATAYTMAQIQETCGHFLAIVEMATAPDDEHLSEECADKVFESADAFVSEMFESQDWFEDEQRVMMCKVMLTRCMSFMPSPGFDIDALSALNAREHNAGVIHAHATAFLLLAHAASLPEGIPIETMAQTEKELAEFTGEAMARAAGNRAVADNRDLRFFVESILGKAIEILSTEEQG